MKTTAEEILKQIPDNRIDAECDDRVAGIWFPDPNWYVGKVEKVDGNLGIKLKNSFGFLDDAHHVIMLQK